MNDENLNSKQPEASLHGLLKQPQVRFEAKYENSKSKAQNPKEIPSINYQI
jgi:hypothetical protein